MIHFGHDVVDFHPLQALRASRVDLDTGGDVYLGRDTLNDRNLENINARL